jgi:hypothetical protein
MNINSTEMSVSGNVSNCPVAADAHNQTSAPAPLTPVSEQREDPHLSQPPTTPSNLTARQHTALNLMLMGITDVAIAAQLDVSTRTLHRWRTTLPAFRESLESRRADLFGQTTDRFRTLLNAALDTLEKQIKDPYTTTSLRASRALLALAHFAKHLSPTPPDPKPLPPVSKMIPMKTQTQENQ